MKYLTVKFSNGWLLTRQDDAELPIAFIESRCLSAFGGALSVKSKTVNTIEFAFNAESAAPLVDLIKELVFSEYGLNGDSEKFSIDVISESDGFSATADAPVSDADKTDLTEKSGGLVADDDVLDKVKRLFDDFGLGDDSSDKKDEGLGGLTLGGGKVESAAEDAAAPANVEKFIDDLNGFIGGDDFKKLIKETAKVAPEIIKNKMRSVFTSRCYLFSINEGNGLDDYLDFFAKFVDATGIVRTDKSRPVVSKTIPPKRGSDGSEFEEIYKTLSYGDKDSLRVLCVDISEWMNSLETREFKNFLLSIEGSTDKFITVFRIPYVDREVAVRVLDSLNDVLCVRYVSFPPFTSDEMQEIASREFKRFGFELESDAWAHFHRRIINEKSDGKFYGIKTVKKVVREMLYIKQLENACNSVSDFVIKNDEAALICPKIKGDEMTGEEQLLRMVGGAAIKQKIDEIVAQILLAKAEKGIKSPCIHMRFVGNPGTGKTTVARVLGKILKEKGVLRIGNFFEVSGRDLCGRYVGETAPKTSSICRDAYGSVLFIDEAYSLYRGSSSSNDYGREALDTLIAEMENNRSDLVVIIAGYTDDIETMMKGNSGLAGRMPYEIQFPNFTRDQLFEIFKNMVEGTFEYDGGFLLAVNDYFKNLPDSVILDKAFSNGRYVRNIFERTWGKAATRSQINKTDKIVLTADDFTRAVADNDFKVVNAKRKRIGFGNDSDENQ